MAAETPNDQVPESDDSNRDGDPGDGTFPEQNDPPSDEPDDPCPEPPDIGPEDDPNEIPGVDPPEDAEIPPATPDEAEELT